MEALNIECVSAPEQEKTNKIVLYAALVHFIDMSGVIFIKAFMYTLLTMVKASLDFPAVLNNTVSLSACVLLQTIRGVLIKILN